jgi:serine-type D-Ala-D-Ala carboxypeptidase
MPNAQAFPSRKNSLEMNDAPALHLPTNMARADESISAFLTERIAAGDFPSAVYAIAARGAVVFADALGQAVIREQEFIPAQLSTIYDLASLTKPLVTGLLCALAIERGELNLDDSIAAYLPQFKSQDKRIITIRHLLTHTSGLAAWRPLYLLTKKEDALDAIAAQTLQYEPGARVVYSDLGFITLGFMLEQITGTPLAALAEREIFAPLNLQRTFFNPPGELRDETAASESSGNLYERGMCDELKDVRADEYNFRQGCLIWGEVHDGNAFFLGGAAGHAGLFSTAFETVRLAEQFIASRTELLAPETCKLFQENMTGGLEEARSVGWQLAATPLSTAGEALPSEAFGHTGFAGTSVWVDAGQERIFVLLTNRTHARPLPFVNINSVRRSFHAMAVGGLDSIEA